MRRIVAAVLLGGLAIVLCPVAAGALPTRGTGTNNQGRGQGHVAHSKVHRHGAAPTVSAGAVSTPTTAGPPTTGTAGSSVDQAAAVGAQGGDPTQSNPATPAAAATAPPTTSTTSDTPILNTFHPVTTGRRARANASSGLGTIVPHLSRQLILVLLFVIAGFGVGIPSVIWGTRDVRRIPHWVWRTERAREEPWLLAMLGGCLLGGWPGVAVVLGWRSSHTRMALHEDWERLDRSLSEPRREPVTPLPAEDTERQHEAVR